MKSRQGRVAVQHPNSQERQLHTSLPGTVERVLVSDNVRLGAGLWRDVYNYARQQLKITASRNYNSTSSLKAGSRCSMGRETNACCS